MARCRHKKRVRLEATRAINEADRFHFQLCSKLRLPLEAVGTKVFVLEFR